MLSPTAYRPSPRVHVSYTNGGARVQITVFNGDACTNVNPSFAPPPELTHDERKVRLRHEQRAAFRAFIAGRSGPGSPAPRKAQCSPRHGRYRRRGRAPRPIQRREET